VQQELGIPFISTAGRSIWEKFNIRSHREIIEKTVNNPKWGYNYQDALLDERLKMMSKHDHFITDRSPIDNLVYFLMQVAPHISYAKTLEFIERAKEVSNGIDRLIYIKHHKDLPLEADGARINNPVFQQCSQLYFDFCLDNYFFPSKYPVKVINTADFDYRKIIISEWLKG
jgi:hypothetical protein